MWRNREAACLGLADLLQANLCLACGQRDNTNAQDCCALGCGRGIAYLALSQQVLGL